MENWQAVDSVVIRAPAERIYETLRDYNNFGRMFGFGRLPRGYRTRILGDEQLGEEGSVVAQRALGMPFKCRIEELEPNRRIVENFIGPNFEGIGIWELEEKPEGVKLSYFYDAADTGWRSRLVFRMTGTSLHHHFFSHGLQRLKEKLESEPQEKTWPAVEGDAWQAVDTVVIRAPADRIYNTIRDYNNFGRIFGSGYLGLGYKARILGPERLVEENSVVQHRILTLAGRFRWKRRVESLEPNRRIVERYISDHEGTGIWELEEKPEGVKVSFLYDAADISWRMKLLHRVMGTFAHRNFYWNGLRRLKRKLEREHELETDTQTEATPASTNGSWNAKDSIVIHAPAERIYNTIRDYNNLGKVFGAGSLPRGYSTRILGAEQLVEEGSVVEHRMLYPAGPLRFRRRVEALEPNRRIAERYIGPNYKGTGTWEIEEVPEGVNLSYSYDIADTGWQTKLVYQLIRNPLHHHFYSHALERLKRKLESEGETRQSGEASKLENVPG